MELDLEQQQAKMNDPLALDSETDLDDQQPNGSPEILGPTPPKRRSAATRRLQFDTDVFDFESPALTSTPRTAPRRNPATRTQVARFSKPSRGNGSSFISRGDDSSPDVGSIAGTSTTPQPMQYRADPSRRFAAKSTSFTDSGVSSNISSSLEQMLAELQESNKHFKDMKERMDSLDSRMKALEECNDADDESESSSRKMPKKRKRKSVVPKDIRVRAQHYVNVHGLCSCIQKTIAYVMHAIDLCFCPAL